MILRLFELLGILSLVGGFSIAPGSPTRTSVAIHATHDSNCVVSRKSVLETSSAWMAAALVFSPAVASAAGDDASPFDAVRSELTSSDGGVAYMARCIEAEDYPALMEFTKTYDQILRKGAMGKAKKTMEDKSKKETATNLANAVTFDLIGINKSSRPGRESATDAAKYLQSLRDDVQKFLALEE